jgi:hypothetical protein
LHIQTTFHFFYKGFVMKKIALIAAMGLMGMGSAMAQTATGNFNVQVNLTPVCQVTTNTNAGATGTSDLIFNYTSFGVAQNPSSTFNVRCTNTLPYTVTLDGAGFGGTTTVLGLDYVLSLTPPAVSPNVGTGAQQTYTINGSMIAGQSGTCALANPAVCSNTTARTLTVSY